jgi:predicted permease
MSWLSRLFHRRALERDLDKELRFHLDEDARHHTAVGVDAIEAERRARVALGGVEQVKEAARDARGTRWLEDLSADLRYALRALRRAPVFTASAVLTLAIGIGANTAVFSIIDALILRSLPVVRPDELFGINRVGLGDDSFLFSFSAFERLRHVAPDTTAMAAMSSTARMYAMIGDAPEASIVQLVSGQWFGVLGARPAAGRLLDPNDNRTVGGHPVAVISHNYWVRRFGRSPSVVGSTLRINGVALTVVGVAPPRFFGIFVGEDIDVWAPLVMQHELHYHSNASNSNADESKPWMPQFGISWLWVLGRQGSKGGLSQIGARMNQEFRAELIDELTSREPTVRDYLMKERLRLEPVGRGVSELRNSMTDPMLVLMGSVALVLLIASANLASLLLARATARSQELSIRAALGARAGRLVRQSFTESLTLALIGGALSLVFAYWGSLALLHVASTSAQGVPLQLTFDGRLLSFAIGLSLLVGFLFGLAPALRVGHADLHAAFKAGGRVVGARQPHRLSLGRALVASQIALSLALVVVATLFSQTLRNLSAIDTGYERNQVATARIDLRAAGYTEQQLPSLHARLQDAVRAVPGVRSVSLSVKGVATGSMRTSGVHIPGETHPPDWDNVVQENMVTPEFLTTMELTLIHGRELALADGLGTPPVAVVSQSMAKHFFGSDNIIGRRFNNGDSADVEVVGVVRDARVNKIREMPPRMAYYPLAQRRSEYAASVEIRIDGSVAAITPSIRAAIASVDRNIPVREIVTVAELLDRGLHPQLLVSQMAGLFSGMALLLAAIGLYGVMAYTVARRSNELGVRLALGARPSGLRWLVLGDTLGIVVIGLAIGVALLLPSLGVLGTLVYGLSPRDPWTLAMASALLLAVGALAGFIPAWRASRINPVTALRAD